MGRGKKRRHPLKPKRYRPYLRKKSLGRRVAKSKLIDEISQCVKLYSRVYLFNWENMKNYTMKKIRHYWKGSRFFMAKNKLMILTLGATPHDSLEKGLHHLGKRIHGYCGLMFSDSPKETVLQYFKDFSEPHYARAGFRATEKFFLPAGILDNCPSNMEPRLRKLGLRTKLNKGIVELTAPTTVCKEGDILSAQQCQILELFEKEMAVFKVNILAMWKKGEGKEDNVYESFVGEDDDDEESDEEIADWCAPEDMGRKRSRMDLPEWMETHLPENSENQKANPPENQGAHPPENK